MQRGLFRFSLIGPINANGSTQQTLAIERGGFFTRLGIPKFNKATAKPKHKKTKKRKRNRVVRVVSIP
jgi:hypothetical protein